MVSFGNAKGTRLLLSIGKGEKPDEPIPAALFEARRWSTFCIAIFELDLPNGHFLPLPSGLVFHCQKHG